jgi:hypothetical protein
MQEGAHEGEQMTRVFTENFNKAQLKEMDDAETLTVPAGGSTTNRASAFNDAPDARGIPCENRDGITVLFYVAGTMPTGTEVDLEFFARVYPGASLGIVTKTMTTTHTDETVQFDIEDDLLGQADFLKITYKFKQGGSQYVVSKLLANVKKKSEIILKTRLTVTGGIPPGSNYSTTTSGPSFVHSGDFTSVGANASVLLSNHKIRILLNGVEKDKNTEITWVNATTFQIVGPGQNPGDVITVYN